jgi:RNA polymerase sigma factor (sigma-70 family)
VSSTSQLPDHFFRHESGRLVARLARRFGARELPLIEDAVQTALLRSVAGYAGTLDPNNVSAWLYTVARNAMIDELRKRRRFQGAEELEGGAPSQPPTEGALRDEVADSELRLLFVCADEALSENSRLVLALKLLSGLSTSEIAARLFLSENNVQKLLERGRIRLAEVWSTAESDDYLSPTNASLTRRLESVLTMLHLLFTSGHASHSEHSPVRRELCEEALRLGQALTAHDATRRDSTWALLAVFHFHLARLDTRTQEGKLILLHEQDRSRWDPQHIGLGFRCLYRSSDEGTRSRYHFEAIILAEHCSAPSYEQTRWEEIVELYRLWEELEPSPLLTLNRAIALAEWQGPGAALELLESLTPPAWLVRYYLWDATLSELCRRSGRFEDAIRFGEAAAGAAPSAAERTIFASRVERARAFDRAR